MDNGFMELLIDRYFDQWIRGRGCRFITCCGIYISTPDDIKGVIKKFTKYAIDKFEGQLKLEKEYITAARDEATYKRLKKMHCDAPLADVSSKAIKNIIGTELKKDANILIDFDKRI